jgi:hypothetical protein
VLCPRRPVFSAARQRLWVLRHTFEKSGTGRSNFRILEYGGFSAVVASPANDKSPRMRPVGMSSDLNQVEGVKEQLFVLRKRAVFTKKNRIADAMRSFLFLNRRVLPSPTPAPLFGLIRHLPTTATFVRNEQPEVLPETKNAESFGESGAYPGFGIRSRCRLLTHEPCISGMRSRRDLARRRSEGDTLPVAADTTWLLWLRPSDNGQTPLESKCPAT